jgi:glycosyltransferase involved in cell wall biosynthesis
MSSPSARCRRDWRLTIAGSLTLAPDAVGALRRDIDAADLAGRVTLTGAIGDEALAALFQQADVFAMSSLFEGYGMALAEAMAHGLPIVTTTGGAAAETVPDAAAIKVPPGNVSALSTALARVLGEAALRRRMADASYAAAALLPSWDDTAREIAQALRAA